MFIVLSSWLKVIARVHSVHLMNVVRRQMAANPQTKPVDLGRESAKLGCAKQRLIIILLVSFIFWHQNLNGDRPEGRHCFHTVAGAPGTPP